MAYTQFDATKPVGTDTGPNFATSANANDKALRDAIIMGAFHGFLFSVVVGTGTAKQPQYMFWKNGTIWVRATVTWGSSGGSNYNITQIVWDLSINGGSDYTTAPGGNIDTQGFTYDTNGNLTATTGDGGITSWLLSLIGRMGVAEGNITSLLASVAALGSMSLQSAAAVAITGGTADLNREREKTLVVAALTGAQNLDWNAYGVFVITVTGAGANFTYSNLPPGGNGGMSGGVIIKLTNGGLATSVSSLLGSAKKPAGMTLSAAATDWIALMCVDGTTPEVTGVTKAVS